MSATPRPRVVTLACLFAGVSAFLLLLQLIQVLSDWGTIEMQDGLKPPLAELRDQGFDVTMGELLTSLRWVGLASVLLLVAALVFAVYAARGDQVSRIGLSVLAVVTALMMPAFIVLGLLLPAAVIVGAAGALWWSPDARQWYAARRAPAGEALPPGLEGPMRSDPPVQHEDPQANPWAAPAQNLPAVEAPAPPVRSTDRPPAILAAGLVTVIGSMLVGGFSALYLVVYGFAGDELVKRMEDGPFADWFTTGELEERMQFLFWVYLAILPLTLAGLAAGLSLLARLPAGRAATLVLAWIAAGGGLLLPVFGVLGLLGTGAGVAVIVLLNRAESRAWGAGSP